jgi:Stage II sporulation protein E (SpoIIE)
MPRDHGAAAQAPDLGNVRDERLVVSPSRLRSVSRVVGPKSLPLWLILGVLTGAAVGATAPAGASVSPSLAPSTVDLPTGALSTDPPPVTVPSVSTPSVSLPPVEPPTPATATDALHTVSVPAVPDPSPTNAVTPGTDLDTGLGSAARSPRSPASRAAPHSTAPVARPRTRAIVGRGGAATTRRGAGRPAAAHRNRPSQPLRSRPERRPSAGQHRPASASPPVSLPDSILRNIPLPLPVPDWSKPIILALILASLGFALRARRTSRRARRLERRQQSLTADMAALQSALVPDIPSLLGQLEISVAYRPADGPAAGGDFYDAFELDRGRVAIILGDVSGHGRAALARAIRMRYTLRAYIEAGLGPGAALKLASSALGSSGDGMFTTVAVAIHDPAACSLTYATAGHPAPLTTGGASHEPLISYPSPPLGWGMPCGRRQTTVSFAASARACFFSDGLIEAHTSGGLLGRPCLSTIFEELAGERRAEELLHEVEERAEEIRDDMAVCIVTGRNGVARVGGQIRREELELDLEQLALPHARQFLADCELSESEIADALAQAHATASEHGVALMTIRLPARAWTVTAPSPTLLTAPTVLAPASTIFERRAMAASSSTGWRAGTG